MVPDIHKQLLQRTLGIQQVMSLFPNVFEQPLYQLKSFDDYHDWNMFVGSCLNQMGYGLGQYYLTGDLFLPPGIDLKDPVVMNLVDVLESAITEVLNICIDPALRAQYIFETQTGGTELLRLIRADYANPNNRELAHLVKDLCRWTSVGCDTSNAKVNACLRKLVYISNKDPFVNRLAGIMYTLMMKNEQAENRVLDDKKD